ncbi:hypothetical protein J6590_080499 [Homalodisca vitripennis]|nr:hypothetical protein J6590_080499 [Homalodisca vitripennis]
MFTMLRHAREDPPPKHQHGYAKEFQLVGSISQTQQTWNYTLVGVDSPVFTDTSTKKQACSFTRNGCGSDPA